MTDQTDQAAPVAGHSTLTKAERDELAVAVSCGLHATLRVVEKILARHTCTDLRRRVKRACLYALDLRQHWAHEGTQLGAARAVAYQSIAGQLQRALEDSE